MNYLFKLTITDSNKLYFSSDSHLGHANIIGYTNRSFHSLAEMNETIIARWNTVVSSGDTVIHCGDFGFGTESYIAKTRQRLNGQIYLVLGNHDERYLKKEIFRNSFEWIGHYLKIKVKDEEIGDWQNIICAHYPFETWDKSHRGSWSVYGHTHRELNTDVGKARYHIGVDTNNFTPISYKTLKEKIKKNLNNPKLSSLNNLSQSHLKTAWLADCSKPSCRANSKKVSHGCCEYHKEIATLLGY